jgi:hypothetical protein
VDKGVWAAKVTGLTENTAYTFTVKAVDAAGRPGVGVVTETVTPQEFLKWTVNKMGTANILNIAGGTERFVSVVGTTNPTRYTSPNGKTWTSATISTTESYGGGGTITWTFPTVKIAWLNNKFIAVGSGAGMTLSSDGASWGRIFDGDTAVNPFSTTAINNIALGNNIYVMVGASGKIARSSDGGETWTLIPAGTNSGQSTFASTAAINGAAFGNSTFVAVGASGKMAVSSDDGGTWAAVADSTFGTTAINRVAWGNNTFVAVGASATIATSPDGTTWTAVMDTPFTGIIRDIAWGNGKFVAADSAGVIAWSTDGSSWTQIGPASGYIWNAVTWGGAAGSFAVAGNAGNILAFE